MTRKLNKKAKEKGVTIIGPATVWIELFYLCYYNLCIYRTVSIFYRAGKNWVILVPTIIIWTAQILKPIVTTFYILYVMFMMVDLHFYYISGLQILNLSELIFLGHTSPSLFITFACNSLIVFVSSIRRLAESNLVVLRLVILVVCWTIYSLQNYTDLEGKLFSSIISIQWWRIAYKEQLNLEQSTT